MTRTNKKDNTNLQEATGDYVKEVCFLSVKHRFRKFDPTKLCTFTFKTGYWKSLNAHLGKQRPNFY